MPIKHAAVEDVPGLVDMAKRMHALTRFRHFEFDEVRIIRTLGQVIESGQDRYLPLIAIGAESRVVGGLIGVLERHIFSNRLAASVMYLAVIPEARMGGYGPRLLRGFETWAKNRGVIELCFGVNSGVDLVATNSFSMRMGYQPVGANYAKSI